MWLVRVIVVGLVVVIPFVAIALAKELGDTHVPKPRPVITYDYDAPRWTPTR